LGIVLDTSGSAFTNNLGAAYAPNAIGINPTNQNTMCLTLRNGTTQVTNTTMLMPNGVSSNFTIYLKHANRFYTDSIFGHGYALTSTATSVTAGNPFTVTFYSIYPTINLPYTISGVLSSDLSGASLTGTFTSNYQAITFNTSSSIASTKNMVITCGTQSKTTTIVLLPYYPDQTGTSSSTITSFVIRNTATLSPRTTPNFGTNFPNLNTVSFEANSTFTSLPVELFKDCTNLRSLTIPLGVTTIDGYLTDGGLTYISLPTSIVNIGAYFYRSYAPSNQIIDLSNLSNLRILAEGCFYLSTCTTIILPRGLTTFSGPYVFYQCPNLTTITIGTPTAIPGTTFTNSNNITTINSYQAQDYRLTGLRSGNAVTINRWNGTSFVSQGTYNGQASI
jgi:hypothetical protein